LTLWIPMKINGLAYFIVQINV